MTDVPGWIITICALSFAAIMFAAALWCVISVINVIRNWWIDVRIAHTQDESSSEGVVRHESVDTSSVLNRRLDEVTAGRFGRLSTPASPRPPVRGSGYTPTLPHREVK